MFEGYHGCILPAIIHHAHWMFEGWLDPKKHKRGNEQEVGFM
jgi:hypothetical protein